MEIITVYYKAGTYTSLQTINWLKEHRLTIQLKEINTITHREIFQLVYLSGADIPDILTADKYPHQVNEQKYFASHLRFSEALYFLARHPELLQSPIVLSNTYALSGYNKQKLEHILS